MEVQDGQLRGTAEDGKLEYLLKNHIYSPFIQAPSSYLFFFLT